MLIYQKRSKMVNLLGKKISVIIPCFNQSQFLEETCNSLIVQTYKDWEAIIIDDGSTDNTKLVAATICKKDSRFNYLYQENRGLSAARNKGLEFATGDFIQLLDSDDMLAADKFEKSISFIENYDIVITNFHLFTKDVKEDTVPYCELNKIPFDYKTLLIYWDINFTFPPHCCLVKKSTIGKTTFVNELKAKEDWIFWLDLFKKNPKIKFINEELAYYRLHQNSMTQQKEFMYSNTKLAMNYIYNSISQEHKDFFIKRIINELIDEKAKSDYLFKVKNENDKKIAEKEQIINNKDFVINTIKEEVKSHLSEIDYLSKIILRIKKSIIYKTLAKLELFIRGI